NGRSAPTRAAPLALLLRRDLDWLRAPAARSDTGDASDADALGTGFSDAARAVHAHLRRAGASFLAELVRDTGLDPDDVEDGLWELAQAGLATADGFAGLRVLVDRARGESRSLFDSLGRNTRDRSAADAVIPPA